MINTKMKKKQEIRLPLFPAGFYIDAFVEAILNVEIFNKEPYKTHINIMKSKNFKLSNFSNEDLILAYKRGVLDAIKAKLGVSDEKKNL